MLAGFSLASDAALCSASPRRYSLVKERADATNKHSEWLTSSLNSISIGERQYQTAVSIAALHTKARRAVEAGEHQFKKAAECLAAAKKLGATQRQSAKAIGKSPAWVNTLLQWQASGFKDTPFGPQSKAKRAAVQATKQARRPTTAEEALAQKAQAEFQTARAVAVSKMFGADSKRIPAAARKELLAALRALASSRDTAAVLVERQRARLNLTWDDLIVPAEVEDELSDAA